MADKGRDHIPYRSSRLTHMLRDSLGGNCRTLLVANVWSAVEHLDETLGTFKVGIVRVITLMITTLSRGYEDAPPPSPMTDPLRPLLPMLIGNNALKFIPRL